MVKWLILSLIAGVGIWLYLRSRNAAQSQTISPNDAATAAATPDGGTWTGTDGTVYQKLGGQSFVITPSQSRLDFAAGGAVDYNPNDPAAAQRRVDALNRLQTETTLAAAQGTDAQGLYQAHLAQSLAAQQKETAVIMAVGGSGATTSTPSTTPAAPLGTQPTSTPVAPWVDSTGAAVAIAPRHSVLLDKAAPIAAGTNPQTAAYVSAVLNAGPKTPPPQPGMTWDYTTQTWGWAL